MDSFDLLDVLKSQFTPDEPYWWPNAGSFEVVVGAVLTQQTKWENVEASLENLKEKDLLHVENLAMCDELILQEFIHPSGFYRKKAKVLKTLCQNILNDFSSYEEFVLNVDRVWLLDQRGIGFESADSILNYALLRDVFVVDSYTNRLLSNLGFYFESYDELQDWMMDGLDQRVYRLYPKDVPMSQVYARFHGKIVMFCKEHLRGRKLSQRGREILGI
ncbi:MAG: hypothetical protein CR967_03470 [Proteobacteria bacterium]|nr:MAG: hypothetical protein CR967_03470 [Pseudomonadota bacterium]